MKDNVTASWQGARAHARRGRIALLLLCLAGALLADAGSASATAPTRHSPFTFDCSATPDRSCGIDKAAVDVSTGDVYVIDNLHDAIDKFDASGSYLGQITGSSTTARTFGFGAGNENQVAVDNSGGATQGNVYVISELASFSGTPGTQSAIFAFNASGAELWERPGFNGANTDTCGVSVDPSGNVWVSDYAASVVQEFNASDGSLGSRSVSTAGHGNPCETAFDASGNLYVDNWHSSLDKYDSSGSYVTTLDAGPVVDVATDLVTGDVYAVDSPDSGATWQVAEWDSSGSPVSGTPFDTGSTSLTGIAINGTIGQRTAYVSDSAANDIHMWDLPAPPPHTVTVVADGTGTGRVDADSGAIAGCTSSGGTCSGSYAAGTRLQLTATPDAHMSVNWTGCDSVVGDACTVTVNADTNVTATFSPIQHTVTVTPAGAGSGTVTSSPAGISCGATCNAPFDEGVTVRLTAVASTGSTFAGWSGGGCSGTGECDVVVSADASVTPLFTLNLPTATTGSASDVSQTTATLGGSVNPNGNATSCQFEYGTSTAYGSMAPCASSPGSGTSAVSVSASLSGLSAGTTYHYRLVASNGTQTVPGDDATFETSPAPSCATDASLCPPTTTTTTTTPPPPPPASCPQDLTKCPPPTLKVASFSGSTLALKLRCTGDAGQTCHGKLTFTAVEKVRVKKGKKTRVVKKTITVASVSYSVGAGGTKGYKLKLTSAAKKALKSAGLTAKAKGVSGSIKLPKTKVKAKKKH